MLAQRAFCVAAVILLGLVLTGAVLASLRPGLTPAQEADYIGEFRPEQYQGRHGLRAGLVWVAATLCMASTIALVRRHPRAPALFFGSSVVTFVVVELLRPYVHPGAGEDAFEFSIVLSAVLLFVLFFSPVKRWYRRATAVS